MHERLTTEDLVSWRNTAIIMGIISLTIFAVQRSSLMFLDPIFEVCIFHVPAILAVSVYLYKRRGHVASILE